MFNQGKNVFFFQFFIVHNIKLHNHITYKFLYYYIIKDNIICVHVSNETNAKSNTPMYCVKYAMNSTCTPINILNSSFITYPRF